MAAALWGSAGGGTALWRGRAGDDVAADPMIFATGGGGRAGFLSSAEGGVGVFGTGGSFLGTASILGGVERTTGGFRTGSVVGSTGTGSTLGSSVGTCSACGSGSGSTCGSTFGSNFGSAFGNLPFALVGGGGLTGLFCG